MLFLKELDNAPTESFVKWLLSNDVIIDIDIPVALVFL